MNKTFPLNVELCLSETILSAHERKIVQFRALCKGQVQVPALPTQEGMRWDFGLFPGFFQKVTATVEKGVVYYTAFFSASIKKENVQGSVKDKDEAIKILSDVFANNVATMGDYHGFNYVAFRVHFDEVTQEEETPIELIRHNM